MKSIIKSLFALSLLWAFAACEEPVAEPEVLPEDFTLDMLDVNFTLAAVDKVSEPSAEGLRTISMTFSNDSRTSLTMNAAGAFTYLESGYYDIMDVARERLEAEVMLKYGNAPVEIEGGSVYVRRKNDVYYLKWTLQTSYGELVCTVGNSVMAFETEQFDYLLTGGTCRIDRDLTLESTILGSTMKYSVCFPESYDESREYPVLYMLHGMDGNNNDWLNSGMDGGVMNAYASEFFREGGREMIIVCPEGRNLFYCNGYQNEGMNYMSYFFEEFIPYIEKTYPIRAERGSRAIGGLSMGGYGTLYYGLLHPEMFCYMYACSAATSGGPTTPSLRQFMATAMNGGKLRDLPGITMEIGTEDVLCYSGNELFVGVLGEYGIAYEYITRPGVHYWSFWNTCSPKILRKAAAAFDR